MTGSDDPQQTNQTRQRCQKTGGHGSSPLGSTKTQVCFNTDVMVISEVSFVAKTTL